jgi:hypothetical protein
LDLVDQDNGAHSPLALKLALHVYKLDFKIWQLQPQHTISELTKENHMNLIAKNIGVDAGMIIVADLSYPDLELTDENLNLGKVHKVPNGRYKVHYSIKDTWNGPVESDEELLVTSGKIIIIDSCYIIGTKNDDDWQAWLDKTNYGQELDSEQAFIIDSMGACACWSMCQTAWVMENITFIFL